MGLTLRLSTIGSRRGQDNAAAKLSRCVPEMEEYTVIWVGLLIGQFQLRPYTYLEMRSVDLIGEWTDCDKFPLAAVRRSRQKLRSIGRGTRHRNNPRAFAVDPTSSRRNAFINIITTNTILLIFLTTVDICLVMHLST